ncbi:hypothetical protein EWU20_00365 [Aquirufa antheringensis]|uniref:Polysaccharide biosynthesis protein C-terminal domain-containing protein n=1 Tax=Aquirufa antheringensis TaxID=2516559 RepID=A0A4Q9BIB8_9BACT|nr:hypothetical protein [Aquirufa antheringensis]TBH75058.1 hypothetical protein EWU20_00365 [Aquirufa antheringensis]
MQLKNIFSVIQNRAANFFLRGVSATSKFIATVIFLKNGDPLFNNRIALIFTTVGLATSILGLELNQIVNRKIHSFKKNDQILILKKEFFIHFICYIILFPIVFYFFHIRMELDLYISLGIYFLLIFEHHNLELFRILISFLKPDLATQLLFLRTFFWILIVFVLTNFFGFRLDLHLIIFVWSFFSFLSVFVTYVKFKDQLIIALKGENVYLKELVSLIIEAKYFIGMLIFSSIISYLDKFILNSNSNNNLTVYFFFFTVCSIISIVVSFSVGSFEGPKAIKVFALNGLNDYIIEKVKLQKAYLNVIVATTILLGIGIFPLLYFINKSEYWSNIHSFFILLISASLYSFSDVYKLDIFIVKKDRLILTIFLIATVTNIILNFVLIRLFSVTGAAYASLFTNCLIYFKLKASSKKVLNHFTNV